MIHIAICDDNQSYSQCIEEQLLKLQSLFSEKIITTIFYSGESFCQTIENSCPFDIVLMDIEMGQMDGVKAGQVLRSNEENDMVFLIYISSHDSYYRQIVEVQPFAFIEKPLDQIVFKEKLERVMNKVLSRRKEGKRKVLSVQQNGHEILISFKQILYLESKIRKITLYTLDGKVEYYGTLVGEEQKLNSNEFVRTHQSYIVNLRFVKKVANQDITLINNIEIPVSTSHRSSIKKSYMEYRREYFD